MDFKFSNFTLECGQVLKEVNIRYDTYGSLNDKKSNAILVFHALSGDSEVAKWWNEFVGEGKAIDTSKYFVICCNVIGGCSGTTGPQSTNPKTKKAYDTDFPFVTIKDMVKSQKRLIDNLGIKKLHAVIGGSMGGMQVLSWIKEYPDSAKIAIPIAAAANQSPQNIGFHEVGRQAIMTDDKWNGGHYETQPEKGLSVARMIGHITYMSSESLKRKFGRKLQDKKTVDYTFSKEFQIESYLQYQGGSFVNRFDANSYLYITRAIDYFEIDIDFETDARFLVISFKSDWLYTSEDSKKIVAGLQRQGIDVSYYDIDSDYGHDSFLVKNDTQEELLRHFLDD